MVLEALGLAQGATTKHGVGVRTDLAERLPPIRGNRVHLQQVVLNLSINACEVMITYAEHPRQLVLKTARDARGGVLIAMRDSGPGVRPEDLERIFEAFYTTKLEGLGMGLSICRSIIQSHGGELSAMSAAPRGAVLQFTLPRVRTPRTIREGGARARSAPDARALGD